MLTLLDKQYSKKELYETDDLQNLAHDSRKSIDICILIHRSSPNQSKAT